MEREILTMQALLRSRAKNSAERAIYTPRRGRRGRGGSGLGVTRILRQIRWKRGGDGTSRRGGGNDVWPQRGGDVKGKKEEKNPAK